MLKEVVREALYGVARNRLRAGLSMLGISWGIVSVVMLLAYGNGFQGALMVGFRNAFGEGVAVIWPGQTSMQAGGQRAGRRIRLKPEDVALICRAACRQDGEPGVHQPAADDLCRQVEHVRDSWRQRRLRLMRGERPGKGQGRWLTDEDVAERRRVVFLGYEVARKLFGAQQAVGQTIRIGNRPFEVVGVMEDKVQMSSYFSPDKYCAFIPWTTMGELQDTTYVATLVFQTMNPLQQEKALRQVREVLAKKYRFEAADERADQHQRLGREHGHDQRHQQWPEGRADVHRRAHAGHRRRRHHEHHVRVGHRTNARDRHPQGTWGTSARDPDAVPRGGVRHHVARRATGVLASWIMVWMFSPRPFLAELLDDMTRGPTSTWCCRSNCSASARRS